MVQTSLLGRYLYHCAVVTARVRGNMEAVHGLNPESCPKEDLFTSCTSPQLHLPYNLVTAFCGRYKNRPDRVHLSFRDLLFVSSTKLPYCTTRTRKAGRPKSAMYLIPAYIRRSAHVPSCGRLTLYSTLLWSDMYIETFSSLHQGARMLRCAPYTRLSQAASPIASLCWQTSRITTEQAR